MNVPTVQQRFSNMQKPHNHILTATWRAQALPGPLDEILARTAGFHVVVLGCLSRSVESHSSLQGSCSCLLPQSTRSFNSVCALRCYDWIMLHAHIVCGPGFALHAVLANECNLRVSVVPVLLV